MCYITLLKNCALFSKFYFNMLIWLHCNSLFHTKEDLWSYPKEVVCSGYPFISPINSCDFLQSMKHLCVCSLNFLQIVKKA